MGSGFGRPGLIALLTGKFVGVNDWGGRVRAASSDRADDGEAADRARGKLGARLLGIAEDVIYVGIAVLLTGTGLVLLYDSATQLVGLVGDGSVNATVEVLDSLLLLFIVVELQFAVRTTLTKRQLVAEPFLLVGILASIKEIVLLSVKAAEEVGNGDQFTHRLQAVGVLGVLVLLLGATAWLMRVKEREPAEGQHDDEAP